MGGSRIGGLRGFSVRSSCGWGPYSQTIQLARGFTRSCLLLFGKSSFVRDTLLGNSHRQVILESHLFGW